MGDIGRRGAPVSGAAPDRIWSCQGPNHDSGIICRNDRGSGRSENEHRVGIALRVRGALRGGSLVEHQISVDLLREKKWNDEGKAKNVFYDVCPFVSSWKIKINT